MVFAKVENLNIILEFVLRNPGAPALPEDNLRRFLTDFISSRDLIFDLHLKGKRAAVAVLLDKVCNKGNHGCLEILGVDSTLDPEMIFSELLSHAIEKLPPKLHGIQVAFHDSHNWLANFAKLRSLELYYEQVEMLNEYFKDMELKHESYNGELTLTTSVHNLELYELLRECFKENIDTNIPEYNDWVLSRKNNANFVTWISREGNQATGFLYLVLSQAKNEGEIRTLGVLPAFRGRGIGKNLVKTALDHLNKNKVTKCNLTVSIQNKKALDLYQNLGFKPIDRYLVYVWQKP
jgi:ribosomal protein S18 acetylase RimI-like enzyme